MLTTPVAALRQLLLFENLPNLGPRYNIAPSQEVAILRAEAEGRELGLARWGLVPFWAEEPKVGYKMINARAETVERLPAFREAYRKRRCLIPADGFFEWQAGAGPKAPKQPFLIRRPDRGPFVFAGLWETWRPKEGGEALVTCTIITTKANARLAPIHQRMPVILEPKDHAAWLDPANDGRPLLRPLADDWLETVPISPRINRPANDDPACIEPLDRPPGDPQASLF